MKNLLSTGFKIEPWSIWRPRPTPLLLAKLGLCAFVFTVAVLAACVHSVPEETQLKSGGCVPVRNEV